VGVAGVTVSGGTDAVVLSLPPPQAASATLAISAARGARGTAGAAATALLSAAKSTCVACTTV
jgi:hypothetical protein